MQNPYESPKTQEETVELSWVDPILRWIGCLALGYLAVMPLISKSIPLGTKLFGAAMFLFLARGVVLKGRKFHLGVAIFMIAVLSLQAYFMNKAIMIGNFGSLPSPANPWLVFAKSVIPHATIVACTAALYFRMKPGDRQ